MIGLISAIIMIAGVFILIGWLIAYLIDKKAESDLKKICDCNDDCVFCPKYYTCYFRRS